LRGRVAQLELKLFDLEFELEHLEDYQYILKE